MIPACNVIPGRDGGRLRPTVNHGDDGLPFAEQRRRRQLGRRWANRLAAVTVVYNYAREFMPEIWVNTSPVSGKRAYAVI